MDKRRLHHRWTRIRHLKPWYFLALALLSGVVCVFALRANNQQMIKLRQAVHQADRNNTDVQQPLRDLQTFVTAHLNTNLNAGQNAVYPPVQLKYTYERLVQAQSAAVSAANARLYNTAQTVCEQQHPAGPSGSGRIPCIEQYVRSHQPQQVSEIPDALYKFAFVSPKWSPDLAGWSLAVTVVSTLLFITLLIIHWLFRHALK